MRTGCRLRLDPLMLADEQPIAGQRHPAFGVAGDTDEGVAWAAILMECSHPATDAADSVDAAIEARIVRGPAERERLGAPEEPGAERLRRGRHGHRQGVPGRLPAPVRRETQDGAGGPGPEGEDVAAPVALEIGGGAGL